MVFQKNQPKRNISTILSEVVNRTNDNTQRLRNIEQRVDSLVTRLHVIEDELLDYKKENDKAIKDVKKQLEIYEKIISEIEKSIKQIVNHVKKLPTQMEMEKIKTLIDIYNPLKSNFVTKEELERILKKT